MLDRRHMCLALLSGAATLSIPLKSRAQPVYDSPQKLFRLDGGDVTYAFGINPKGQLEAIHWGGRLGDGDTLGPVTARGDHSSFDLAISVSPLEYSGFGGGMVIEPGLKVAYPDGSRDVVLNYLSHSLDRSTITVRLKDIARELYVDLRYTMDVDTGVLSRSAMIENRTNDWIEVQHFAAAIVNLPVNDDYRLHYLTGRWAAEWTLQERPLEAGSTVLESRRGSTGHQNNPWIAISRRDTDEEDGPVWIGALGWSGSWRISIDKDAVGGVHVVAGYNPFDFDYRLAPGEKLESPTFYAGYSAHGMGGASRLMHRFQRNHILPGHPSPRLRPVLYNSWEATTFAVDARGQMALAEKAAALGIERFVMDDGWFGGRNSDKAGLGDWWVNPQKFPKGLKPLISKVRSLGMEFGLWVEPEMVNADSDLYRAHPDWIINFRDRPRTEGRNQMVLNLARPDVRDHLLGVLDGLLRGHDISFLKWDYNRNWSEPGWPEVTPDQQPKLYVDYIRNLYGILAELRRRHPTVEIESCAGGGGRVEMGIMALTDQVWPSDNTDPYDRLTMQDGFSHAYAPAVMMAWVTDSPNWVNQRTTSLAYRFLSSMQGGLGIGANLNHWDTSDFATAKRLISEYKTIRKTVQQGDLYRVISPQNGSNRSATLSVSTDQSQAVLFAFTHSSTRLDILPAITLRGLDPRRIYRIRAIEGSLAPRTPHAASGAYWMTHGLSVIQKGDFQASLFGFEAQI